MNVPVTNPDSAEGQAADAEAKSKAPKNAAQLKYMVAPIVVIVFLAVVGSSL